MSKNSSNLHNAKNAKNDEFYTRLEDIEKELKYYRKHFRDKVVFCNCDDPYESNFFKYFALNFNKLGLKKLISTCYAGSDEIPLFDDGNGGLRKALKAVIIIDELYDINGDGAVDEDDIKLMLHKPGVVTELSGDGSFNSPECIELLKQSDIVCTNPPFSLFRDFVNTMFKYDKKFLIIGNKNAITYKEIFPLIKNNKIWLGITSPTKFETPKHINNNCFVGGDGKTYATFGNIGWFTNLEHPKRNEELFLIKKYKGNDDVYPKYDNCDAINVNKVDEIPCDYDGVIGVPITFLDKYCPEQFDIVGILNASTEKEAGIPIYRTYNDFKEMTQYMTQTGASGVKVNGNPVLKGKSEKGNFLFNEVTQEYVYSTYARVLIKRK